MTEISVATWNLHQAVERRPAIIEATWRYLEDVISPSVALVQEATALPDEPDRAFYWPAGVVRYDTAVVAYDGSLEPLAEVNPRVSSENTLRDPAPRAGNVGRRKGSDPRH